jgi:nucleoside-diphosphate-sugar epimerase
LFTETRPQAVVHLAFVSDPARSDSFELDRMWQTNVAGTARVMEAITEFNRHDGSIGTFVFPSSVTAYGPLTPGPVKETHPLGAHTLPFAVHKRECDDVVRFRSESLGDCTTFLLRCHHFAGPTIDNCMIRVLRGIPTGKGKRAKRMREQNKRLSVLVPGKKYLESRVQFVHIDDVARLIGHILHKPVTRENEVHVLNVAGRGEPLTLNQTTAIANARVVQVPGIVMMRLIMSLWWRFGISGVPVTALPYLTGSYTVDTSKLKQFLGSDYEKIIQYSVPTALADSFSPSTEPQTKAQHA